MGVSPRHVTSPDPQTADRGEPRHLWHVPDDGQVLPMDHRTASAQSAEAFTLDTAPAAGSHRQE